MMQVNTGPRRIIEMSEINRDARERLCEATQDGLLDPQTVVEMVARWMTNDEIIEMCDANEINLARMCGD